MTDTQIIARHMAGMQQVMAAAAHWADMRETGSHQEAMEAIEAFRAAILAYGRAERERAAKVCDEQQAAQDAACRFDLTNQTGDSAGNCASAIRSLPDEASPSGAQGVAA